MEHEPRTPYPSDLSDEQWQLLQKRIPPEKPGGRPRSVDMREVVNAMLYLNHTGCQWDMLPHDFPPKSTVHEYFSKWRDDGTWQQILDILRKEVRRQDAPSGKPSPSAASIDSQTMKIFRIERNHNQTQRDLPHVKTTQAENHLSAVSLPTYELDPFSDSLRMTRVGNAIWPTLPRPRAVATPTKVKLVSRRPPARLRSISQWTSPFKSSEPAIAGDDEFSESAESIRIWKNKKIVLENWHPQRYDEDTPFA